MTDTNDNTPAGTTVDAAGQMTTQQWDAAFPVPDTQAVALTLTLHRTLGMFGEAFGPPGPHRAYTYEQQPGNTGAYRLGLACNAAAKRAAGDDIDRGLSLLQELQAVGFGVFQIETSDAAPQSPPAHPVADERAAFTDWAEIEYRHAKQYDLRDFALGLAAWKARAALAAPQPAAQAFQARVQPWMMECFGAEIAGDREERNHRFLEEALELVQACGCTASEAHQLVGYVFGRPVGEPAQEVGGVMVTMAALCLANGLDMHASGEAELARIWTKVEQIRAKQAAKPKHSPLPMAAQPQPPGNAAQPMGHADDVAAAVCQSVAELPDRDSPADWPEAMLVTHEELHQIVREALAAQPSGQAVEQRACNNEGCGWTGTTDRMLGSVGPLCPACGETTEACRPSRQAQQDALTLAATDVLAERWRQISTEGWTPEQDDRYTHGDLASAAGCYATQGRHHYTKQGVPGPNWPFAAAWWKPSSYRRNLVKAGALVIAEIERLDRAAARQGEGSAA